VSKARQVGRMAPIPTMDGFARGRTGRTRSLRLGRLDGELAAHRTRTGDPFDAAVGDQNRFMHFRISSNNIVRRPGILSARSLTAFHAKCGRAEIISRYLVQRTYSLRTTSFNKSVLLGGGCLGIFHGQRTK
jgi:hypothetical protein